MCFLLNDPNGGFNRGDCGVDHNLLVSCGDGVSIKRHTIEGYAPFSGLVKTLNEKLLQPVKDLV